MKKLLFLLMLAGVLTACDYTEPNDRALFNLQGAVHVLSEYNAKGDETLCLVFTPEGYLDLNESSIPYDLAIATRKYGAVEGKVYGVPHYWNFDDEGRLEKEKIVWSEKNTTTIHYKYKGDSFAPHKVVKEGTNAQGVTIDQTAKYDYTTDEQGNWLTRSMDGAVINSRTISYHEGVEAVTNCPMERTLNFKKLFDTIRYLGGKLLMLIALCAAMWHMIKENYRTKYRTDYNTAEFCKNRMDQGLSVSMSDEENTRARNLLDEVYDAWTRTTLPNGEEIFCPMTREAIFITRKKMAEVIAMNPTDKEVVERINAFNETLSVAFKREFNGSKPFMWVTGIFAGLTAFLGCYPLLFFAFGLVFYWLASRPPLFMTIRKELKGTDTKSSIFTYVIGLVLSLIGSARTYKTVTYWSDGTTSTDYDNSEFWFYTIIGIAVMTFLATLIILVGLINYIRNYHLYR